MLEELVLLALCLLMLFDLDEYATQLGLQEILDHFGEAVTLLDFHKVYKPLTFIGSYLFVNAKLLILQVTWKLEIVQRCQDHIAERYEVISSWWALKFHLVKARKHEVSLKIIEFGAWNVLPSFGIHIFGWKTKVNQLDLPEENLVVIEFKIEHHVTWLDIIVHIPYGVKLL